MKKLTLSYNEKLTMAISICALLISIASPIISYYWLQNSVREQNLKAEGFKVAGGYYINQDVDTNEWNKTYHIYLTNGSPLSVDKVLISFRAFGRLDFDTIKKNIVADPPARINITSSKDTLIISLDDALSPGQKTKISTSLIINQPNDIERKTNPFAWVSSEATPSAQISWQFEGGGASGSY